MINNLAKAEAQRVENAVEVTNAIINSCLDAKAKEITALNIKEASDVADYVVVVSGRSDRQVQGIGNRIIQNLAELGIEPSSIEGYEKGHWLLLDFDDVVVHIFFEPTRPHYNIEGLWPKAQRLDVVTQEPATETMAQVA